MPLEEGQEPVEETTASEDFVAALHGDAAPEDTVSEGGETSTDAGLPADAAPPVEAAPEPVVEATEEPVTEEEAWKSILGEAGFSDIEDMDSAAQRSVEALRQRDQQIETLANQVRSYQYAPPPATAAPAAPEPSEPISSDPLESVINGWQDVPLSAREWIDPESGDIRPDAPAQVRQSIETFAQKQYEWSRLVADPRQFVAAIDSRVQKMIDSQVETGLTAKQAEYTDHMAEENFLDANADWLYAKDPVTGAPVVDPISREQVFGEEGQRFLSLYQQTEGMGVGSIADRISVAKAFYDQQHANVQAAPVARREGNEQVIADRRREMQGRTATGKPSQQAVNNVSPGPGERVAGEQQMSVGQSFFQELSAN